MLNNFLKLALLVLLIPHVIFAQDGKGVRIYGQVLSYDDYKPLSFASIVVKGTGKGTVTSESGYFELGVPSDTSTLIVSYVGYKTKEVKLSPVNIQGTFYIKLGKEIINIDEVTVAVEKERIIRVTDNISSVKISPLLIAKLPNLGEVDVLRSFQLLPGVSATNETSAGLYVRGGTPDQNLILFDGMTIYHVDHFYGFFSAFNANTIDDIELIKGGFPAKYGGRISSMMEITGKPADMKKISGGGSLSLLSVNTFLEVPVIKNKFSWQVAARRSYTDLIRTGLYNKIFNLYEEENQPQIGFSGGSMGRFQQVVQQPRFHFYDINSKLTFRPDSNNTFALSFYDGKDKFDNSREISSTQFTQNTEGEITDIANWGNTGLSGQWIRNWNDRLNSTIFLSWSEYFSRRDRQNNFTPGTTGSVRAGFNTFEDNKVEDFSLRLRNKWALNEMNTIEFGFENTFYNIRYTLENNDTIIMVDRIDKGNQSSLYIQHRISLSDKLHLNLGIRGTYFGPTNKIYLEPRISAIYEPIKNVKLKGAWGKYYQFTTRIIREDVLQGSKDFWLLADGETIPEASAFHYIAGISYEKYDFLFDMEAFYKDMKGLTEYSMRSTSRPRIGTETQEEYFFEGKGYAKGIEFLAQKKYGLNTGWIAYTLSEVKHIFPDLNYGKTFYALHDQTHEFKTVYCRKIKRWDLSAAFIFATGRPYTAPESEYQLTLLDGTVYNYIHVSDKNSLRLPDYHRLDVSASYSWRGEYTQNAVSVSVFNLYNRKNIWYKEYDINENEVIVTDVQLLGITPNVSLTIKF